MIEGTPVFINTKRFSVFSVLVFSGKVYLFNCRRIINLSTLKASHSYEDEGLNG